MIGQTISHYKVTAKLGAGGMGEVYRATDTKLGRDVALKVLPGAVANDKDRMARFEREAQVLASLNHPNIATIHGLEEGAGIRALAMELVEGPTLAERIALGPIPLEEALPLARQIAEALEYAHERGIIHRDLKPANIKITADGKAKVLDFGLAKALLDDAAAQDSSSSPTLSMAATKAGIILGTAAYMSPEQARGKPADKRADIWAFGVVLYEMLSGKQIFGGETASDSMAAVIARDPDWSALPTGTPSRLRRLMRRCLTKDPRQRLRDIGEARIAIEEALSGTAEVLASSEPLAQKISSRAMVWVFAGIILGAVAGIALWNVFRAPRPATRQAARLLVTLPPGDRLASGFLTNVAYSPDGSRLVYVANHGDSTQLFIRPINRFEVTPVPGTEGAEGLFFSPDGQSVGFFAEGKMKKVSLSGGAPETICSAAANRGASWGPDGTIIFAPAAISGLFEVPAAGGTPKPLTTPDHAKGEASHRWPEILPGGKAVLFTSWSGGSFDDARIVLLVRDTSERRVVVDGGSYARYISSGHLIYARAGGLLAVPFDLKRLEVTGPPVPVLEDVRMNPGSGRAEFSFSADGSLVYVPGGSTVTERALLWVDRSGTARPIPAPRGAYMSPRLSPDGQRIAIGAQATGLWLYEITRGALMRLTQTNGAFPLPIWTPDGKRLTFRSMVSSSLNLHWMPADGSAPPERLTTTENMQSPGSWSPDGKVLAFSENDPKTGWDIEVLKLDGDRKPLPLLQTPSNEGAPAFSPNGQWLVYQSDESGRWEIYLRPYPGPGGRSQISTEGGTEPTWARSGRELFYRNGDKMMAVAIETKKGFAASKPMLLFEGHYERTIISYYFQPDYDVSPDGQRFLMLKASEQEGAGTQLNLILNWFDELRQRVPAGKK